MSLSKEQKLAIIRNCKKSFVYFCEKLCYIKHPNASKIPFKLFSYQKKSVSAFRKYDRLIFRKCRQCGISTLTGAYGLWVSIFHPNKRVLIVSKRDEDAKDYLDRNVKYPYINLPEWMHEFFGDPRDPGARKYKPLDVYNEHELGFWNGSSVKSLTSSKDTLRSNTASLVIIDESAFIHEMESMWLAGQQTVMQGGKVIVISTPNGKDGWYYDTWQGSITKENNFYPIDIAWWDMDWVIEWQDEISGRKMRIAPCDGIEDCKTEEDKQRFGPKKSPWLINQYKELIKKGESWKFRQEVLKEFISSGNTVLSQDAINQLEEDIDNNYKIRSEPYRFSDETFGIHDYLLNFQNGLWIWELPVKGTDDVIRDGRIIRPGVKAHRYVIGADISSGESNDYSAAEVIDATTKMQVAELRIKCETSDFAKMLVFLGKLYNMALIVAESTGIGKPLSQDLKSTYYYPNLFYRRLPSGKRDRIPGFPTTNASKPDIVKILTDYVGLSESENGVLFRSSRFYAEACIFVHLGGGRVGNETKGSKNDDLMIAGGLACLGLMDALQTPEGLIPTNSSNIIESDNTNRESFNELIKTGGHNVLYPVLVESEGYSNDIEKEMSKFIVQIGGISKVNQNSPIITNRKHVIVYKNK